MRGCWGKIQKEQEVIREMEEELDIILSAVDNASDTFESVAESANEMGEALTEGTEEGTTGFEDVEGAAESAVDPMEQISNLLGGFVGAEVFSELAGTLMDFADKAGAYSDSMMRARLEAEGAGISANEMTDAVSELSATTGRAGGEIRESFIKATARGITDMDSFKSMMEGAGAQATLLGTDIQSMGDKFSSMAMRSTLMERQLSSTGITMEELADAMNMSGATADEVKDKWAELDTNQRAAILGQAASMNEGKTANEEYKKSWAGLHEQLEIAKGRLERLAGEVILPVLVPAMELAARVLDWLGDTISRVMKGPLGTLISVIGSVAAAFVLAVPAYMALSAAIGFVEASAIPAAIALWGMVAPLLPFIAVGAAVALVIYEIGKAFGWWTDVSSMLDAIWAGIQRLWSAFINHPDVVSFINALKMAWAALQPYIQAVVNWVMSFFNQNSSGKFDVVRALIDALGKTWELLTLPIRNVITVVKFLWTTMNTVANNIKTSINNIRAWWAALPGKIRSAISTVKSVITKPFQEAYNKVKGVIDDIKSYVGGLANISLSSITDAITKPFRDAYDAVCKQVDKIKQKANEITGGALGWLGFGGPELAYGGLDLLDTPNTNTSYTTTELKVTNDINLSLDLRNVPDGINEELLYEVVKESFTDKSVINALVNNNDFQNLDNKVKRRITMKNNRARGA